MHGERGGSNSLLYHRWVEGSALYPGNCFTKDPIGSTSSPLCLSLVIDHLWKLFLRVIFWGFHTVPIFQDKTYPNDICIIVPNIFWGCWWVGRRQKRATGEFPSLCKSCKGAIFPHPPRICHHLHSHRFSKHNQTVFETLVSISMQILQGGAIFPHPAQIYHHLHSQHFDCDHCQFWKLNHQHEF